MKDLEKLAIWLIPFALLGAFGSTYSSVIFNDLVTLDQSNNLTTFGLTISEVMTLVTIISPVFKTLTHIVIAIWLFFIAKRDGNQYFIWAGFGLFFGLLVPLFYYVVKIYETSLKTNEL